MDIKINDQIIIKETVCNSYNKFINAKGIIIRINNCVKYSYLVEVIKEKTKYHIWCKKVIKLQDNHWWF